MFNLFRRKNAERTIEEIYADLDTGRGLAAPMTAGQALDVGVVLACVSIIADGICVPELQVMRHRAGGGKEPATNDPRYRLLHRRPNEFMTSFEFRQMVTVHAALTGAGYFLPVRDVRTGRLSELLPLLPEWVTLIESQRYAPVWEVRDEFGLIGRFDVNQIVVIRSTSWDTIRNLSPVRQARAAIGLAAQEERNLLALSQNGGRPSGLITTDQQFSKEAIEKIKAAWNQISRGAGRAGVGVLDNGAKFTQITQSAVDAQTLETRRFQIEEICRAFGVYPIMVGHSDKSATYASAEAFFKAHQRRTVLRWQRLWIERLDEWVLDGAGPLFVEFDNQEERLAGLRDQAEYFARALGSGGGVPWLTINEVRAMRGLASVEEGDRLYWPVAATQEGPEAAPGDTGEQE